MSENKYYKENIFKRSWNRITGFFKGITNKQFDAVAGAIGFFVLLVAMLEYKVLRSMYNLTGDVILTASALLVTAFGGVYSEVVLRRNENATDDQNMWADWIFYVSLATSAFVGFGAWAEAIGMSVINLWFVQIPLPEFASLAITVITLVTIFDILTLRAYFRADVNAVHRRNVAQSNSKKRQADLNIEDQLIEFEAEVKAQSEQILRVEARRVEVRQELQAMYGGRVPEDVMNNAMKKLDEIMQEIKTGEDLNKDGHIGLPVSKPVRQPVPMKPAASFASTAPTPPELKDKGADPTRRE